MPFLSFKGITYAYLLQISITHNKNLNLLLNLLINYISVRSAPQILSIKDDSTFLFSNFLIVGLCNSSANSLLQIILFSTVSPEVDLSTSEAFFYQKKLETIEANS